MTNKGLKTMMILSLVWHNSEAENPQLNNAVTVVLITMQASKTQFEISKASHIEKLIFIFRGDALWNKGEKGT